MKIGKKSKQIYIEEVNNITSQYDKQAQSSKKRKKLIQ